jgi:hypothetical protein
VEHGKSMYVISITSSIFTETALSVVVLLKFAPDGWSYHPVDDFEETIIRPPTDACITDSDYHLCCCIPDRWMSFIQRIQGQSGVFAEK